MNDNIQPTPSSPDLSPSVMARMIRAYRDDVLRGAIIYELESQSQPCDICGEPTRTGYLLRYARNRYVFLFCAVHHNRENLRLKFDLQTFVDLFEMDN